MTSSLALTAEVITGTALYLYGVEKSFFALGLLHAEPLKQRLGALPDHDPRGWLAGIATGLLLWSNRVIQERLSELAAIDLLACRQTLLMLLASLIGTALPAIPLAAIPPNLAVIPLVAGLILLYVTATPRLRLEGHLLLGLGLLFLGIATLSDALPHLPGIAATLDHPWIALPAALLIASLLGSATAVVGLLLPLAAMEGLSTSTLLLMILAANLGAALPIAILIKESSAQLKRLLLAQLIFVGPGLILVGLWPERMASCLVWLPLPDPWRLVLFHIGFNILIALIGLLPLRPLVTLAHKLLPDPFGTEIEELEFTERYWPRYLDEDLLNTPTLALAMARRETGLIAALIEEMLVILPEALFAGDGDHIIKLRKMDDRVDEIHRAVTRYLASIGATRLNDQTTDERMAAMTVSNELESIGDVIENNFAHLAEACLEERVTLSNDSRVALEGYHQRVLSAFRQAADAFLTADPALAQAVMAQKESVSALDARARQEQMRALQSGQKDFAAYSLFMDLYENYKRIYYHTKRIAKVVAGV
ncbi:MAG: Na/Pi symporter [Magnetococcus sp. YQC-9]